MFKHLLVPTDGSELSERAIDRALSFAKEARARITFFFARPDTEASLHGETSLLRSFDPSLLAQAVDGEAREILGRAEAKARAAGVEHESVSRVADEPYEGIIATAGERRCDLILMASNGHRGVKGLLLGSQTQKVLLYSKHPVLVFR
jgi:nucleotide-binding universal stress UspA family protein